MSQRRSSSNMSSTRQPQVDVDIMTLIIDQVIWRATLYNLCLASKTFRYIALRTLYRSVSIKHQSGDTRQNILARLQTLAWGPSSSLLSSFVTEITIGPFPDHKQLHNEIELMDVSLRQCLKRMNKLRSFRWDAIIPFKPSLLYSLRAIESLRDLSIVFWENTDLPFGNGNYHKLLAELSRFRNLRSLELHGLCLPDNHSTDCISSILRNSLNLECLGLSINLNILEDHRIEQLRENLHIGIRDFFATLCKFFEKPAIFDDHDKVVNYDAVNFENEQEAWNTVTTPQLSLKRLHLGCGYILTKHIHLLTNTTFLEDLAIANGPLEFWDIYGPYEGYDPALASLIGRAPSLRRVSFDNFENDADCRDINILAEFKGLQELVIGDIRNGLVEELTESGAIGANATKWKQLTLGRSWVSETDQLIDNQTRRKLVLTDFVAECEALTELVIGISDEEWEVLLEVVAELPQLLCLDVTVTLAGGSPEVFGFLDDTSSLSEDMARQLFDVHPSLAMARVHTFNDPIRYQPTTPTWVRRTGGLEVLSQEELPQEWAERGPFHWSDLAEAIDEESHVLRGQSSNYND